MAKRAQCVWQIVTISVVAILFVALGVRLFFLQLLPHKEVTHSWRAELMARRGQIFDRNGRRNLLATSVSAWHVFADPKTIQEDHTPAELAPDVAEAIGVSEESVLKALTRTDSRYIPLRDCLDVTVTNRLAGDDISGIGWRETTIRHYPVGSQMCYVLGFVGKDGVGMSGVERAYNQFLKGKPGVLESKADARRRELPWERSKHVPAVQGAEVSLTLDQVVQHIAETELASTVEEFGAVGGCVLVQKVATGEILAMASWPRFDPNYYAESEELLWKNRCIGYVYEPGSTLKAISVAAVMSDGIVTPDDRVDCGPGYWRYGGYTLHDHVKGVNSVRDIVKKSSNIGAAKLALRLGDARFETYLRAFGVGAILGIDIAGEEKGILAPSKNWSKIKPTRVAIGQGVSVTPLQMLGIYCAIGNRGRLMRPYIVKQVTSSTGESLYEAGPKVLARPVRPPTAATMCSLLKGVAEQDGTGRRAAVEGYTVAGKTGTAQIWDGEAGRYSNTEYVASFVGLVPAETPEIGVIVVIERPRSNHYGGVVAAPAFSRIAGKAARYLEVVPTGPIQSGGGLVTGRAYASVRREDVP